MCKDRRSGRIEIPNIGRCDGDTVTLGQQRQVLRRGFVLHVVRDVDSCRDKRDERKNRLKKNVEMEGREKNKAKKDVTRYDKKRKEETEKTGKGAVMLHVGRLSLGCREAVVIVGHWSARWVAACPFDNKRAS